MATPTVREVLQALKPGEHSRGIGRCPACGSHRLRMCEKCGQHTLHNIGTWTAFREEACENGCTTIERSGYVVQWRAEMKEALYQLERRES